LGCSLVRCDGDELLGRVLFGKRIGRRRRRHGWKSFERWSVGRRDGWRIRSVRSVRSVRSFGSVRGREWKLGCERKLGLEHGA
jgi:hypothetical protein